MKYNKCYHSKSCFKENNLYQKTPQFWPDKQCTHINSCISLSQDLLTRIWKFIYQHSVHCHYVGPSEALDVLEDLQGRRHQKTYQKHEMKLLRMRAQQVGHPPQEVMNTALSFPSRPPSILCSCRTYRGWFHIFPDKYAYGSDIQRL